MKFQFYSTSTLLTFQEEFEDKAMLNECVKFLIGAGYVMQTGFDAITLVHWKLAMNWAIKTYHVLRSEKVC